MGQGYSSSRAIVADCHVALQHHITVDGTGFGQGWFAGYLMSCCTRVVRSLPAMGIDWMAELMT